MTSVRLLISCSLEAALAVIEMIVKEVGGDELAADRAFHLHAVLYHFIDVLYCKDRVSLLRSVIH